MSTQDHTYLVTGASGLLGSMVCRKAIAAGHRVRGLVRRQTDAQALAALGVEPVIGDVTSPDTLAAAFEDVGTVVHSAAVLGGTWSTASDADFDRINYHGSLHVLDAAKAVSAKAVVIGSLIVFRQDETITERTRFLSVRPGLSAYARSKLAVYYEGMHRVCRGEDICFVMPGAMYGPSAFTERALDPTSFTGAMHRALHGQLTEYANFPLNWSYVEDAGAVVLAAAERGRAGALYLAAGGPNDALSLAAWCNMGCAAAGVTHRVRDLDPAEMTTDLGSMRAFTGRSFPDPLVDPAATNAELGVTLTPVREGIERTVGWMRIEGLL